MSKPDITPSTTLHPLVVRVTHWVNAFAMLLMITSGWRIYNASPIFDFTFPRELTLGGWLGGALQWHFAAMWLLVVNGLVYLAYGLWSGHLKASMLPLTPRALYEDARAALTFKLEHGLGHYNAVQKALYLGVLALGVLVVLSGLAVWKPVQFHLLASLFGGYEGARIVHFLCMSGIVGFVIVHLTLVALVPSVLLPMITGRAPKHDREAI
ncbi:MAG: cytochrome b/b6 domain-containing protein [Parvibaculum sp.]